MAKARHVIAIDDSPILLQLVEQAHATGEPISLQRSGAEVARVEPVPRTTRARCRAITEVDIAASRAAAGGWRGNVDVDQFHRANEESRRLSISRRRPGGGS